MAKYYVAKPNHPTFQKIEKLMEMAEELGLTLSFSTYRTLITDKEFPDREFYLEDLESDPFGHCATITEIPYNFEFKLIRRDEND